MAARNPNLPNPADLEAVWRFLEEVRACCPLPDAIDTGLTARCLYDGRKQGTNTIMTKLKDGMSYQKYMELYTYVSLRAGFQRKSGGDPSHGS